MKKFVTEGSRSIFVMTSDGNDEINNHGGEVIANTETVCRFSDSRLCWTAGDAIEHNLCAVKSHEGDVMGVSRVTGSDLEKFVRAWACDAIEGIRYVGDGKADYGMGIRVETSVDEDHVLIELIDDDGYVSDSLFICKLEG